MPNESRESDAVVNDGETEMRASPWFFRKQGNMTIYF